MVFDRVIDVDAVLVGAGVGVTRETPTVPEEAELMPATPFTANPTDDAMVVDVSNVDCTVLASTPLAAVITAARMTLPESHSWTLTVISDALTPFPA